MFLICCNIFIKLSFHRISAKFLFGASAAAAAIFRQNVSECTNGCLNIPDAVGLGASHRCPPRHPQVPVGRASQAPQPLPSHSGELWAELRPTPGWNEPDLGTRHCRMNAWVAWPWPPPHHISSAAAAWTGVDLLHSKAICCCGCGRSWMWKATWMRSVGSCSRSI